MKPCNVLLITLSCVTVRTNRVKINILKQLRADIQPDCHCDLTSRVAPVRYVILSDGYPPWHPLIEKIHTNKCGEKKTNKTKTRQWHGIRIWHVQQHRHTRTKLQPFSFSFLSLCCRDGKITTQHVFFSPPICFFFAAGELSLNNEPQHCFRVYRVGTPQTARQAGRQAGKPALYSGIADRPCKCVLFGI